MLIAQLSDLHVRASGERASGIVDTAAMTDRAIDAVLALAPRPDAVLLSGDLADIGTEAEYRTLRPMLERLPMPIHAVPGNHDRRGPMRAVLGDLVAMGDDPNFLHHRARLGPIDLIALDSVVEGDSHGALCENRLAWLEAALGAAGGRPALLMVHHPPSRSGITFMDRIGLLDDVAFGRLVQRHANIERVTCGHIHRSIQQRWRGTILSVAPGVAHHVVLDLEGGPPGFVMEPPAFQLHLWLDGTGLVTHQVPIGAFSGPHRFGGA